MKLAVSALAWDAHEDEEAYALLQSLGVTRIEGIPKRVRGDPALRHRHYGLDVLALQALLYGFSGGELFGDEVARSALKTQLEAAIATPTNASHTVPLVFGCPRNRHTQGRHPDEVLRISRSFFGALDPMLRHTQKVICLEPNPAEYGTDFLNTLDQCLDMANALKQDTVAVNLDTGAALMNDEWSFIGRPDAIAWIRHCHVSAPHLGPIDGSFPAEHRQVANWLRDNGYEGLVSIEMRRASERWQDAVKVAVDFVRNTYGAA